MRLLAADLNAFSHLGVRYRGNTGAVRLSSRRVERHAVHATAADWVQQLTFDDDATVTAVARNLSGRGVVQLRARVLDLCLCADLIQWLVQPAGDLCRALIGHIDAG